MPSDLQNPAPKRVRIAPWRGPLSLLWLLSASTVAICLPLLYIAGAAAIGAWLGSAAFQTIELLATTKDSHWGDLGALALLGIALVTWVFSIRPLMAQKESLTTSMQVSRAIQPDLFELLDFLCWHLRIQPPEEVWLDPERRNRLQLNGGVWALVTGSTRLTIGLSQVGVLNAREFSAMLCRELGVSSGRLGAIFRHLVREMDQWYYRSLMERESWELELRKPRDKEKEKEPRWKKVGRLLLYGWMTAAKAPFALCVLIARAASLVPLRQMETDADRTCMRLLGEEPAAELKQKIRNLEAAWIKTHRDIEDGMVVNRLPENLPLLIARQTGNLMRAEESDDNAPFVKKKQRVIAEDALAFLPRDAPAAAQIRSFVDLARQVTYFYYQHDLKIALHEHRLVAEEEMLHKSRREDETLLILRRYFSGLAHPERAIYGLGNTHKLAPGPHVLLSEIRRGRAEVKKWGIQMKVTLQEWNIAWQRRRDLESAQLLSMAGFTISRLQFGTRDTTPEVFAQEAHNQATSMEHMEHALQQYEARLETRFAAALGLLWWSAPDNLSVSLSSRRNLLPKWVGLFEAMASVLPTYRELLTVFYSFQTLGTRFAHLEDAGRMLAALHHVTPRIMDLAQLLVAGIDGAPYPFIEGRTPTSLTGFLMPKPLPKTSMVFAASSADCDPRSKALKLSHETAEIITPLVDNFMKLYHQAYAWLAETAEESERHFLGDLKMGSELEILSPEDYKAQQEAEQQPRPRVPEDDFSPDSLLGRRLQAPDSSKIGFS